ncbi:hypothetical protein GCM10009555_075720 [Acrocarpospora macrocephala]|uniref:Uncharacterized protein n=1 Tax=Acrocarpospora macrocephala TaxID=150177 RepID=A0A5M3X514_9ACTN|nr:hypothetical protein Amac_104050 [Acrocarpospora macrocephala]
MPDPRSSVFIPKIGKGMAATWGRRGHYVAVGDRGARDEGYRVSVSVSDFQAYAAEALALAFDFGDADAADLAGGGDVRAAVGLAVEADMDGEVASILLGKLSALPWGSCRRLVSNRRT